MSEGTPRPRRTYSSSQEAAQRAHESVERRRRAAQEGAASPADAADAAPAKAAPSDAAPAKAATPATGADGAGSAPSTPAPSTSAPSAPSGEGRPRRVTASGEPGRRAPRVTAVDRPAPPAAKGARVPRATGPAGAKATGAKGATATDATKDAAAAGVAGDPAGTRKSTTQDATKNARGLAAGLAATAATKGTAVRDAVRGAAAKGAAAGGAARSGGEGAHPAPRRRRLGCLPRLLLGLLLLLVLAVAGIGFAYSSTDLPNANALASSQVSIVYFSDGTTELGRITGSANRESVDLKKIPEPVQKAFLAAEDRTFYTNSGVSISGIGRAVWTAIRGGETQGGSTITQQYVKNYFLTSDQTYKRKIKEIFLAVKLDQEKSKDQILEDYLNTIYFGRGAYGIQTAAKAYFDKDVSQLNPAEGAVLASIVRGPSLYDPSLSADNKKRNTDRATWILDSMVQLGWLPKAERASLTIPQVVPKKAPSVTGGTNGYIVAAAKAELKAKAKLTDADFERGGLKIVTTIDKDQQANAVAAVERYKPSGQEGFHIGLAAVKPGNGGITAMYGGPDFLKQQFNDATQGKVPAGSTFKVFALIAAVEKGIDTNTQVDGNQPYNPPGSAKPINNTEGESSMGTLTLRDALAKSVNTAFARLNIVIRPSSTAEVAGRLGVPVPDAEKNIVGNVLGQSDATPVQMAGAYAALAAKGLYVQPHIVASAKTDSGKVSYTADTTGKQVVKQDVVADVVEAMQRVVRNGTATDSVYGRGLTRPAAGKTGTGENSTSAWFDGFVPQQAAAVAMTQLNSKNARQEMSVGGSPVYGGGIPTMIWARYMVKSIGNEPVQQFPARVGVGTTGLIGTDPQVGDIQGVKDGTESIQAPSYDSGNNGNGNGNNGNGYSGNGNGNGNGYSGNGNGYSGNGNGYSGNGNGNGNGNG